MFEELNARCPNCNWVPPHWLEYLCEKCDQYFNPIIHFGQCPNCNELSNMSCDKGENGCGQPSSIVDWYYKILGMVRIMIAEVIETPVREFNARKMLEKNLTH